MTGWSGAADDVQVLVDELADELGRSVVVNDPLVRPLCTSRHFGDADPVRIRAILQRDPGDDVRAHVLGHGVARWTVPATVPGEPALGLLPRLCAPLRVRGEYLGTLMVIDADGSVTDPERALVAHAAGAVAALLAARAASAAEGRAGRQRAVHALLGADPDARDAAVAELGTALPARLVVVTVEVAGHGEPTDAALAEVALGEVVLRGTAGRGTGAVDGPRAVRVRPAADPDRLSAEAAALREAVCRALGPAARVAVGVGGAVDAGGAWQSARQAEVALRAARRDPAGVAVWEGLRELATLLCLPDDLPPDAPAARALRALAAHDSGDRLRETLAAYLDHAGSVPRTAKALTLHRTSLYHRLRRIEEITGMDLSDGRDRLVLHLGLRLEALRPER